MPSLDADAGVKKPFTAFKITSSLTLLCGSQQKAKNASCFLCHDSSRSNRPVHNCGHSRGEARNNSKQFRTSTNGPQVARFKRSLLSQHATFLAQQCGPGQGTLTCASSRSACLATPTQLVCNNVHSDRERTTPRA
jgi:hypothetical protein